MGKKIIAICVARLQDSEQEKQVRAICDNAYAKGFQVLIYNVFTKMDVMDSHAKGELSIFGMIPMAHISAIVILSESIRNETIASRLAIQAKEHGIPVVSINHRLKECYNVLLAYDTSFEKIVRHVVEYHGCRKINFMAGFEDNEFSDARIGIFQKVLAENGLPFEKERLGYGQFWERPARKICEEWVSEWESGSVSMPDAVICANDIMAITVCNVLLNHGIRVPEDVIVTGFDGLELGGYCTPKLTTARDDIGQIGYHTMNMISRSLENPEREPYDILIPFHVKYNESCGCEPVQNRNLNEEIMIWYGKAAESKIRSTETFLMMTMLADGYSAVNMVKKLEEYQEMMYTDNMMLCVNSRFYEVTDIEVEGDQNNLISLAEIRNGKFTTPMTPIGRGEEYEALKWMLNSADQLLFVPIHWQTEIYGYMVLAHDAGRMDYGSFYDFVLSLEQVLETIRRQSQLHRLNVRDVLTSLYNRRGFYGEVGRRIDELQSQKKILFFALVDMDGLKYINDNYGHSEGDYAIKILAELLEECIRGTDGICARFGGDEYMVAIVTEKSAADLEFFEHFGEKLQTMIEELNQKSGKPYEIGASCGMLYEEIQNTDEIDSLLKRADDAMYSCKSEHHKKRNYRSRKR